MHLLFCSASCLPAPFSLFFRHLLSDKRLIETLINQSERSWDELDTDFDDDEGNDSDGAAPVEVWTFVSSMALSSFPIRQDKMMLDNSR